MQTTREEEALAGGAPPQAPAVPEKPKPRERVCKWTDDSQFNLAAWMAGKLRATIVVFEIPEGKLEVTFRELNGTDNREIDAMVSRAIDAKELFSEGDHQRFRNVAITAASIVSMNGKAWPEPKKDEDPKDRKRQSVYERTALLRESQHQSLLDLTVKACADFQEELIELARVVDPKLFASPSGASARR